MTANFKVKRAESLMRFCSRVAIPDVDAKSPEPPFSYNLNVNVRAGQLKAASESDYTLLKNAFGNSLFLLEVSLGSSIYICIENGEDKCDLVKSIDEINKLADEIEMVLKLTIDKMTVVAQMELDQTHYNCLFYFFNQNLTGFLSAPLLKLDQVLFENSEAATALPDSSTGDKPTVIVVSDAEIYFAGEMLTIVGESVLDQEPGLSELLRGNLRKGLQGAAAAPTQDVNRQEPNKRAGCLSLSGLQGVLGAAKTSSATTLIEQEKALLPLSATLQEQINKYRAAAFENPSLIGQQFRHLTPLHFLGQWKKKDSALERILARQFVNICILYTANRSTFNDKQQPSESIYNSSDRTATLSLKEEPTAEISTISVESLAKWLYSGKGTDQRTVFQNIIARELYGDDPKANYNNFISRISRLWKDAVWQYQVFVDGKITKHFEELQKVIGYIADVNKKISEAVDSITKSLTDALLATVGVVVLTVLAALVKKDTSIEIFKISMQVYSVYLLFYAIYRMGSIGDSYRLLSKDASTQLAEYQAALRVEEITDLSLPLKRRRRQFHIWFWLTVALYLGLAGSIWWASKKGPQLLIDRGIITAPGPKTPGAT